MDPSLKEDQLEKPYLRETTRCIVSSEELLLRSAEEFITEGKPADYFYVLFRECSSH